ncbi:MAG TPA: ABC-type transport auxiliary lipoprotein family protein [Polyangiaceae bacterium LLY-WYZ-14_1]|nr:ABC-type transport auxiliary lipoprotein family protein [Polyangiaceae bacterium LLY-WYZ-14_1]
MNPSLPSTVLPTTAWSSAPRTPGPNFRAGVLAVLLLPLGGVGCFGQSVPDPVRYDLGVDRDPVDAPAGAPVLRVGNVRVPPRFDDTAFVYLDDGGVWRRDFYSRFAEPPGTVVRELLTDWLEDAGLFAAVLDGPSFVESDLRLRARIRSLYVDRREPDAPAATLSVVVEVARAPRSGGELLLYRRFEGRESLARSGGAAVRDAYGALFRAFLAELEGELREVLGPPSSSGS